MGTSRLIRDDFTVDAIEAIEAAERHQEVKLQDAIKEINDSHSQIMELEGCVIDLQNKIVQMEGIFKESNDQLSQVCKKMGNCRPKFP